MDQLKIMKAVIVNATTAFNVEINCYSFHLIYGRRDGNGFIAIPNWGVCVEAAGVCRKHDINTYADDYCSYGERKGDYNEN